MSAKPTYMSDGARGIYLASTQAGVATSVGLSATQTGFTLTNPAGSGKTLVVLNVNIAQTVAPAASGAFTLTANVNPVAAAVTQTTPLTVRKANLGVAATAVGLAASSVTLPTTSVVVMGLGGGPNATGGVMSGVTNYNIDGAICVAPGCALSVNSVTTAVTAVIGMIWEEVSEIS